MYAALCQPEDENERKTNNNSTIHAHEYDVGILYTRDVCLCVTETSDF